jgi:hypothetical protein
MEGHLKKLGTIFGLFAFSFLFGYGVMVHTSEWGPIARDPAAVRQVYDFSSLSGSELNQAMKKRLLSGASVIRQQSSLGVELGHFAMAKLTGEKTLACQEFDKVVLKFEAEGVAISGERPEMEVEGACEFSSDMTKINPIFIPVDRIMAEKPGDGEIQYREGKAVTLRFHGMPDQWPTSWLLTSVRLSNPGQQKELLIDTEEVNQILGRPMMVNFK